MTSKRKSYSLEDKKRVIEWIFSEGDGIPTLWVSNISETLTEFELLKGEEEDPFFLEEGLQETIVLED